MRFKQKTHEEFLQELNDKNFCVIPIEQYIKGHIKIKFKCLKHNYIWETKPEVLLQSKSRGCRVCASENRRKKLSLSYQEFILKVSDNIIVLGKYINNSTKIKVKCKKCNHVWNPLAGSIFSGSGCPKCKGEECSKRLIKPHNIFIREIKELHPFLKILENYKKDRIKIKYLCTKCDGVSSATPSNLLRGHGCPICKLSQGEKEIKNNLKKYNIKYEAQKIFKKLEKITHKKSHLKFDFYLPDYNLCIEYQGVQHYKITRFNNVSRDKAQKGFLKGIINDQIKWQFCKDNNIKLLEIPYWEKENIKNIIRSYLKI